MIEMNKDTLQKIKALLSERMALDIDVQLDVSVKIFSRIDSGGANNLRSTTGCGSKVSCGSDESRKTLYP